MTAATLLGVGVLEVVDPQASPATATADRAVVELELRHGQALFGFVRRQGLTDVEAQDAVQDVLVRLWLELRSGRTVESPRAWAYRSVYRIAMDHHRLRTRVAAIVRRLEPGGAGAASDTTDRVAVWAEVDRLPGAAAAGALPALSGGPPVRRDRFHPRDHLERGAEPRDAGDRHASTSAGPRGRS